MVICSCVNNSLAINEIHGRAWTKHEILMWSFVDRTCYGVRLLKFFCSICVQADSSIQIMEDIRDYRDDLKRNIPTIPVLLHSIKGSKCIVLFAHVVSILVWLDNPYIIVAVIYSIALACILDHKSSRAGYYLSYHSQTVAFTAYVLNQMYHSNT